MAVRVTVSGKGEFRQQDGETLLAAGLRAGFGFPQACRNGNCEKCASILLTGNIEPARQLVPGYYPESPRILPCICRALTDCHIEAPNVTAPGEILPQKVTGRLTSCQALSSSVEELRFQLPAGKKFHWHAGQYLLLENPLDKTVSAFSIANACIGDGKRELVLHVRHEVENTSAQAIMKAIDTETLFKIELPFGNRCLSTTPDKPVWLIAGSTGFAPAQAMLQQLQQWGFELPVHCYRGAVRKEDIYPTRELVALLKTKAIALTEAVEIDPDNHQFSGRALDAVRQDIERLREIFLKNGWPLAYIGGSPEMCWATFDALVGEGWPSELIHSDVFDYAPRN